MNKKIIYGVVFAGLAATAGSASAAITGLTIIDFQTLNLSAIYGSPNLDGSAGNTQTYLEKGVRIGIVDDPLDTGAHLHKASGVNIKLQYHADSSGIYVRAADDTAFSLQALDFLSPYNDLNPHTVGGLGNGNASSDYWHIYGFSDARNPGMLTANGTYDPVNEVTWNPTDPNGGFPTNPAVAHATVVNGTDKLGLNLLSPEPGDLLSLNGSFGNIKSFWIHYNGYPHSPNTYVNPDGSGPGVYDFAMEVDNIKLNAPVPVPAAVWMFLSGMMGLLALGRKKSNLTA